MRLVIVGGENASEQPVHRRWKRRVPPTIRLINGYGATEATVTTTLYPTRRDEESLPIGRPISNTSAIVLDDQLHPVALGEQGELYIGGVGLARGSLTGPN